SDGPCAPGAPCSAALRASATHPVRRHPAPTGARRREEVRRAAVISDCGRYRYSLTRRWGDAAEPRALFVMLNPSTADAEQDDPTIRRCIGFAKAWGMGSLEVVNLYALRATDPAALLSAPDPIGPKNDTMITSAA